MRGMKRQLLLLNTVFALLAIALRALRIIPDFHAAPLLVIVLLLTLSALNVAVVVQRSMVRKLALGILGLGAALAIGEVAAFHAFRFLHARSGARTVTYTSTSGKPFVIHDDILGNVPTGDNAVAVDYRVDGLSKKLTYTFDHNGMRITPRSPRDDAPAILFFGCSMTFGEGVDDCEVFPYLVGRAERERYQAYNIAFKGQGPNHMYSAVRCSRVRSALGNRTPALALYTAISDHVRRVLGQHYWNQGAPCYVLEAGALRFRGCFGATGGWPLVAMARRNILLLRLFDEVMSRLALRRALTDGQIALFVALVERSQQELRNEWPGLPFVVLFLDEADPESDRLIGALRAAGVRTLKLSEELPELCSHAGLYRISAHDYHYNPAGHRLLARYIVDRLESGRLFEDGRAESQEEGLSAESVATHPGARDRSPLRSSGS
jgi:hypothetical protein